jgi:DNA-binding transcriptional MocR family regulator
MPGAPFFPGADPPRHHLRLNFSPAAPADVARALAVLAALVRGGHPG